MLLTLIWLAVTVPTVFTWTRAPGLYASRGNAPPLDSKMVTLTPSATSELFDVQYGKRREYRGMRLAVLMQMNPPPAGNDTVLLHFDNDVIIDLSLSDVTRLNPFVAIEVRDGTGAFSGKFEPVPKEGTAPIDWLPIKFYDNKIVVESREHPSIPRGERKKFSPWMYASTLIGIEYVNRIAYFDQFALDKTVMKGLPIYEARCHFCHGVRGVGGDYGWDFSSRDAILTVHSEADLLTHVTTGEHRDLYREMPLLADITDDEATALWHLMIISRTTPLRRYSPLPVK